MFFFVFCACVRSFQAKNGHRFDLPGSHQLIEMQLQQSKVGFLAPALQFPGAAPSLFVWCGHDGSTVVYPSSTTPIQLDIQARQPPPFIYKQFNASITSVALTLQLEFSPLVAEFSELDFPRNYYDQAEFRARPSLPAGLSIDVNTGEISGIPILAGLFYRTIVAISRNPPRASASFDLEIQVKDVLGLRFTSASADNMLLSIQPRSTNIFRPQKAFLLARRRTSPFTDTPDEFFCINALRDIPFRNISETECSIQDEVCCCASYILLHMPVQDIRIRTADCGFEATERYHIAGLTEGLLQTSDGVLRPARLHSSLKAYATMPPEVTAQDLLLASREWGIRYHISPIYPLKELCNKVPSIPYIPYIPLKEIMYWYHTSPISPICPYRKLCIGTTNPLYTRYTL